MTWISSAECAELLGVSARRVRQLVDEQRVTGRRVVKGRNANALEILLSSLPADAQARHFAAQAPSAVEETALVLAAPRALVRRVAPSQPGALAVTKAATVQERAHDRLQAVLSWVAFRREHQHLSQTAAEEAWLAQYQITNPEAPSIRSLRRWVAAWEEGGRTIDALIDGNDGHARRGKNTIHPDLVRHFNAIYLQPTKPTIKMCHRAIEKVAVVRGLPVPSYDALKRHANAIAPMVQALNRAPEKKRSAVRPFVIRDYALAALEMIQADDHQIDIAVACSDPLCTVGHYPWITAWIDIRSRKVLSVELHIDAGNWKHILTALHRVYTTHGTPNWVYVDNGAPYIKAVGGWGVKHFDVARHTARMVKVEGFDQSALDRVCGPFGVQSKFSIEGNPQSKLIERWFLTLINWLYPKFESYRGRLGERSERAEYLRKHPELLPTMGDLAIAVDRAIEEYNATPHRGEGMDGRSPNEVFEATRIPKRVPDPAALALAFWDSDVRTVQKNGIEFRRGGVKWWRLSPEVQGKYFRKKVVVRFSDEDLTQLIVCDGAGRFLCTATPWGLSEYGRTERTSQAIADVGSYWRDVMAALEQVSPASAKELAKVAQTEEEFWRIKTALDTRNAAAPVAASGGGSVVTVIDSFEGRLARDFRRAQEIAANPANLTRAQLELAATAEDHSEEFLDLVERAEERRATWDAPDDEDLEPIDLDAERRRVDAIREQRRKEAAGECIECPATAYSRGYCITHWRPEEGD